MCVLYVNDAIVIVIVTIICIILSIILRYEQKHLAIGMRGRLLDWVHKKYLDKWFTFFRISQLGTHPLSTIDQRCTQDIEAFATGFSELYGNILKPSTEIAMYVGKEGKLECVI